MLRALLICLLALALPMQGAVASAMVVCGPNHHGAAARAAAAHEATTAQPPQAHAALSQAGATDGSATLRAAEQDHCHFAPAGTDSCSACAACGSSAAILQAPVPPCLVDAAAVNFAELVPSVAPFAAGGPERPPRARIT